MSSLLEIWKKLELIEAEAWANILHLNPAYYEAKAIEIQSSRVLITKSIDSYIFNRVIGLGVFEKANPNSIEKIIQIYKENNIKNFTIHLTPFAQPDNLASLLKEYKLKPIFDWVKMYRSTDSEPEIKTGLCIKQIDKLDSDDFAIIASTSFNTSDFIKPWFATTVGMPNWFNYIAYEENKPIATGAMYVKNEVAWIGFGGTLPEHRKKGAQGALLAYRIKEAKKLGCKWICTETDHIPNRENTSLKNMVRAGFHEAYLRTNYI